jgi:hypothetical protein
MITLIFTVSPALDSRKYRKSLIAAAVTLNSCNGLTKGIHLNVSTRERGTAILLLMNDKELDANEPLS